MVQRSVIVPKMASPVEELCLLREVLHKQWDASGLNVWHRVAFLKAVVNAAGYSPALHSYFKGLAAKSSGLMRSPTKLTAATA